MTSSRALRLKRALALALMAIPAVLFYVILWRDAVRIPILDDYDIILGLLNGLSHYHSLSAKLAFLLTSEHNGYKLVFENLVVSGQFLVSGQLHLLSLVMFGNAFALFIFLTVLGMSRVQTADPADKWVLLVPVAWLVFQLQYASALDFASSSLQHLAVISFSLLSISLLDKDSKKAFALACAALLLAVASSPNGFFAGPAGLLLLAQKRRWRRVAAWTASMVVLLVAYLFHYHHDAATSGAGAAAGAPGGSHVHLNAGYALSFLGASAARLQSVTPSLVLGLLLCGVFILATVKQYYRRNPAVYYSMFFILINAVAVSGLRSDQGVAQSLASRYRLYSNLFLAFSYMFMVESLFRKAQHTGVAALSRFSRIRFGSVAAVFLVSAIFCFLSDLAGARFLHAKKQALTYNYRTEWQGQTPEQARAGLQIGANPIVLRQLKNEVFEIKVPVLQEAVRTGVYQPPQTP